MLHVLSLDEARQTLLAQISPLTRTERITAADAAGRILAQSVCASADVPGFDRSSVDGLAVHAADTFGAGESLPAMLQLAGSVAMGEAPAFRLGRGECAAVPTGGALPEGADAMVMIEYVEDMGDGLRLISRPASPGDHLVLRGDDFRAGQTVLPAGRRLRAADAGTLAALDVAAVDCLARPRVAIISTGDELVPAGMRLSPGQIHDVNSPALAALVRSAGGEPLLCGVVRDDLSQLTAALSAALDACDLVLVSGGSSVGEKDHLNAAIAAQGEPGLLFHGIAVKPGKPTLAGAAHGKVLLGLPGHPLAAWFMANLLAVPLVHALQGVPPPEPPAVQARTACRIPSNVGRESVILVRLIPAGPDITPAPANGSNAARAADPGTEAHGWLAEPVFSKSGLITVLSQSDGFIRISRDREGLEAGDPVTVWRLE